jgi:phage-related minor tail protein
MDAEFDRDAERRLRQMETLERLSQRLGTSLSEAFGRGASEGKRLDGVLASLSRALLSTAVRSAARSAVKPLASGLGDLLKGALSGEAAGFARGGVVAGGQVRPFARGGVVAAPTYFPLGGSLGLMGEAGAEAIMPLARGADGRLGVRAAAAARPTTVTVNIAATDLDSFRRSEAQVGVALARAVARGQRGL